jgi:hypothetical protein
VKYWEIIADKLSKAGWSLGSQPWIPKDERCGLLMHTAMMEKGLSFARTKCSQHSSNLSGLPTMESKGLLIRGSGVRFPGRIQLDQRRRATAIFLAKKFVVLGPTTLIACLFPVRRPNLGNPTRALGTE